VASIQKEQISMHLPPLNAHFSAYVHTGNYVARRLRRAKLTLLADDATLVTSAVLAAGRAREDADAPIQDALADRDAADDLLDDTAQDARAALAGRSASASKEEPYTLIFHSGSAYYTAAPLDEEVTRYGELADRLAKYLPAKDPVLVAAVPALGAGLDGFGTATAALGKARTAEAMKATDLAAAIDAWRTQMEKTYGALVAQLGKSKAERFFPREKSKAAKPVVPASPPSKPA
jgi:hypothetical protein